MATAMHEGTTFPQSPAWRYFHRITSMNLVKTPDELLSVYADLCWEEAQQVAFNYDGHAHAFYESMTAGAQWAVSVLPTVNACFQKTRMTLCGQIVHGWLFCRSLDKESQFAKVLRQWPDKEHELVSKEIRRILEYRFPLPLTSPDDPTPRLVRFIAGSNPDVATEDTGILRTISKAVGRYASVTELVNMAQGILEGSEA